MKFWHLALVGLILRLAISTFQYSGDIRNHYAWGNSLLDSGPSRLYQRHFPGLNDVNYPPVAIALFAISNQAHRTVLQYSQTLNQQIAIFPSVLVPFLESDNTRFAFLKIPAILADLGIAYLIFRICLLTKRRWLLPVSFVLFNPALIYISSVWGQIESIPIFFLLLAYYLIAYSSRFDAGIICLVLAALSKQTALWLYPAFILLYFQHPRLNPLRSVLLFVTTFVLIFLPFSSPLASISLYLSTLGGSSRSVSDQAYNLWFFIFSGKPLTDDIKLMGISVRNLSLFILLSSYSLVLYKAIKNQFGQHFLSLLAVLSILAFFFQTRVHERHLAPAIFFAALPLASTKKGIVFFLLLSAYHMINLYTGLLLPFI